MWSFYLLIQYDDIIVILVNFGFLLDINMVREVYGKFWLKFDKGVNIVFDLVIVFKYKGVSGQYFDNDQGGFGFVYLDVYKDVEIYKLLVVIEVLLLGKQFFGWVQQDVFLNLLYLCWLKNRFVRIVII